VSANYLRCIDPQYQRTEQTKPNPTLVAFIEVDIELTSKIAINAAVSHRS
jgi:hypothetical protein